MAKKRLIGVVTVRNGFAVQSFGYQQYLPLGKPEYLVENLDRWQADEILIQVIDRSINNSGPDYDLISRLSRLGLATPLIYSGGIATAEQAVNVIQAGADRVAVDFALSAAPSEVQRMSRYLGAQALIGAIPTTLGERILRYDYTTRTSSPLDKPIVMLANDGVISEVMLIDWMNEGGVTSLIPSMLEGLPFFGVSLILFGGLAAPSCAEDLLHMPSVAAVAVGNLFSYKEHAYNLYKRQISNTLMRNTCYCDPSSTFHL